MSDDYVAYLRYSNGVPVTCDSDSPGAFKVYRRSALADVASECCAIIMAETGNGTIEPWQEKRLVREIKDRFAPESKVLHVEVPVNCTWCKETYMEEDESKHLETCAVFSTLPVSQIAPDGRTFVTLPGTDILVERKRKH